MPQVSLVVCKVEVMELQLFKGNLLVLEQQNVQIASNFKVQKEAYSHLGNIPAFLIFRGMAVWP